MNLIRSYAPGPLVWSGVIATTCILLWALQKVLWLVVPFLLALVIYYMLLPLKHRLVLRGLSHDAAAGVAGLGAMALGAVLAFWIGRGALAGAADWPALSARYLDGGIGLLTGSVRRLEESFAWLASVHAGDEVAQQIGEFSASFARHFLPKIALTVASWAPSLLLAPFIAFFMLRDGWRFHRFVARAVPNAYFERALLLAGQIDRTARLYFIGLLQLTVLDTVCLALGLWAIGIDGAWGLGLAAAVMAWVPFVGSVAGCLLVVMVAATDFPGQPGLAYAAILLFVGVRLLDDFVFMPLTLGKSLELHPLLTVLMIFVGGAVAGVAGLMLVLPVLGVVLACGETLGGILADVRLRARAAQARRLRLERATADLRD